MLKNEENNADPSQTASAPTEDSLDSIIAKHFGDWVEDPATDEGSGGEEPTDTAGQTGDEDLSRFFNDEDDPEPDPGPDPKDPQKSPLDEGDDKKEDDKKEDDKKPDGTKGGEEGDSDEELFKKLRDSVNNNDRGMADEIAEKVFATKKIQELVSKAEGEGKKVSRDFVSNWLERGRSIEELNENGIYGYGDLLVHLDGLKSSIDPDRELMPKDDDDEAWQEWFEKRAGIPSDVDGYTDDIFEGMPEILDDDETKNILKSRLYRYNVSKRTARAIASDYHKDIQTQAREEAEDLAAYKADNYRLLKNAYGENFPAVMEQVSKLIKQTPGGAEFRAEYGEEDVFASSSFINFLYGVVSSRLAFDPQATPAAKTHLIQTLPLERLEAMQETAAQNMKKHSVNPESKEFRENDYLAEQIARELIRRRNG